MNTRIDAAGRNPRPRTLGTGRIRPGTFYWQPLLNLTNREPTSVRNVSRDWHALLLGIYL